jgi:hypothetical protein
MHWRKLLGVSLFLELIFYLCFVIGRKSASMKLLLSISTIAHYPALVILNWLPLPFMDTPYLKLAMFLAGWFTWFLILCLFSLGKHTLFKVHRKDAEAST